MNTQTEDKLANAKAQGQAQFDSIREMVEALQNAQNDENRDDAEQAIQDDPLAVEVRGGWYTPHVHTIENHKRVEYRILLCTGGPACQIVGELSEHGEPETAVMQVQDWFMPWSDMEPIMPAGNETDPADVLLAYARCFYFGE